VTHLLCGSYAAAIAHLDEVIAFAEEKGAFLWKANGTMYRGCVLAASRQAEDAIKATTAGLRGWRSTGATVGAPFILLYQARAYSGLDQFDDARRCVGEALTATQTSNERWFEAEIHRIAGEIALASPERDIAKAEADFERALVVARAQRAKSWELRTATSKARLWRDQGKRAEARDLLAPIYGWFTEGFDTLDLREAKALLDALPP
jgi:predicted ATPase